jgi:superfamily II DNA or RNA helicase
MLHMPTGSGKTRMAMHIVSRFLVENGPTTVIWLANSEELCDQAADEFERAWSFLGNRSVTLNRYWGRHDYPTAFTSDGLVVGGFPKLFALARRSPPAIACLGDLTGLLVIDEAHQAIAPTYELIIQGLAARSIDMPILGLSATPGRSWNDPDADKKLADFFSQKKVTLNIPGYENPIDFLVTQGYLAKPNFRSIQHTTDTVDERDWGNLETELDIPLAILKMLAADEVRTIRIIREIEELCQRHSRIIVFATTVLHADLICAILTSNISAECITSKTVSSERSRKIAWYKANHDGVRVIVNFGVLTTGFDAPLTSATLIARPTKSLVLYSQMVGRAIRGPKAGGNREAEVVTVVDTKLAGFGDLAEAFKNWEDVW